MIEKTKQNRIPFLTSWFVTIGNTIYIPKKYYNNCRTVAEFKRFSLPLFEHENLHSERQEEYGVNKWLWKYITDKSFKWQEEKLAYKREIEIKKALRIKINKKWYFDTLKKYNMTSDEEINKFLNEIL